MKKERWKELYAGSGRSIRGVCAGRGKTLLAACFCVLILAGCGGSGAYDEAASEKSAGIGFDTYEEQEAAAVMDDADMEEPETEELEEPEAEAAGEAGEAQDGDKESDSQDKILVYEGSVSIDTIEFEDTVHAFQQAVEEAGGFLEEEHRYGGTGKYDANSSYGSSSPRSYMATARIPSELYQDFMQKTEGLGNVTESYSEVTNMTRQYGTLKAELEIYEAEYERYLKMFEEVSDDAAMVSIQEKLTELSLNIARTKSEMSVIDTDAAFSTVQAQIYEVQAYEESGAGFWERLVSVFGKSWKNMLKFFENLLFFFILHWYHFLLLFVIVFVIIKIVKRSQAKSEQKMRAWQEERRQQELRKGTAEADTGQTGGKKEAAEADTGQTGGKKEAAEADTGQTGDKKERTGRRQQP